MMENQNTFDMTEIFLMKNFRLSDWKKMQRSRFVRELDIGRMHGEDLKKIK